MRCPYLEAGPGGNCCAASTRGLLPSYDEQVGLCMVEEHDRCPLLMAHVLRGTWRGVAWENEL